MHDRLDFPAPSGSQSTATPVLEAKPPACPAPILVVDDDPSLCGFLKSALTQLGYGADAADGVAAARELLSRNRYSLVLCDYEMPGGNGLELLAYVNRHHPELPFIILTGHDESSLARTAIAFGAADFIAKPFELRRLTRLIEQNQARAERDRARTTQLTREVLHGTIRTLVAAVDAKDPYTASHSERVSQYAILLGQAIGLTTERLQVLEFAALLHDVGKIAVPERILLKQGKLNAEEWEVMKLHPVHSAQIVGKMDALGEVATIVRHHHERIDGAGYPDGLAGEEIPYLSRLIAIVDAYEAMTTDRSHRPALHPREARGIIRDYLGSHFDRKLGLAFLNLDNLPRLDR